MKRVIAKNAKWVATIFGLALLSAAVVGYILTQQGVRFPWQASTMRMYVDLDNAQAVTPGQGQSVQVAGVKIGTISAVELEEGRARVAIDIDPAEKGLVRTDAHAMLRPRTPLKDMYIQILPGSRNAPPARKGTIIPVENTTTDVQLDQILGTLDERTREYLQLLAEGAGHGLKGRGTQIAEVFRRFGPTAHDLRTVNQAVGQERAHLRRVVTSLADLNGELAKNPDALAQLVDASAATFTAFASEDGNLRRTLSELPPTLRQARSTLSAVRPFADELGPTTRALTPSVQALDRANGAIAPFAKKTTPIIRTLVRPFARAARPIVRQLGPAATDLSKAMPELSRSGRVANRFFNLLAFNQNGSEGPDKAGRDEGYLFWIGWLFHQGVNLQNVEDANGPMRPIFLTGTCGSLTSLAKNNPLAEFGLNLSPVLATQCGNPDTISGNLAEILKQLPGLSQILPLPASATAAARTASARKAR